MRATNGGGRRPSGRAGLPALACLLTLAVLAVGALLLHGEQGQERAVTARYDARQYTAQKFVQAYVNEVYKREQVLAGRAFSRELDPAAFDSISTDHGFAAAVLLDDQGRVLASQPANPSVLGVDVRDRYEHLRSAVAGVPAVSGVVPSLARQEPVVGFAVPFETADGRRVFSGAYHVETIPLAPFARNATPFRTGEVLMVDADGRIVASSGTGAGAPLVTTRPELSAFTAGAGYLQVDGRQRYVRQSPIPDTSWRLVFSVDTAELFEPIHGPGRWIKWFSLLSFAVLGAVALLFLSRYQRSLQALRDSEALRREVLDTTSDAYIAIDHHGVITDWNTSATQLLGWSQDDALGSRLVDLVIPPDQREAHLSALSRFVQTGQAALPAGQVPLQAQRRDGTTLPVEMSLSRTPNGATWRIHAFLRDATERLHHETQLRELALTDPLTGLGNRRAFMDRLHETFGRARRHHSSLAVVYIDIDKFKTVNDRHGHSAGDAVLVEIATRLRATLRAEDGIARLGGDEFAVVCEDLVDDRDAQVFLARLRTALNRPHRINGRAVEVTASVGVTVCDATVTVDRLLDRADAAMYEAKATRKAFAAIVERQRSAPGSSS